MVEKIWYRVEGSDVVRRVRLESGDIKTSKLPIPVWVDMKMPPADIYDISWLASSERPRVRTSAREICAADLFCGCGGLTLGVREAARGLGCGFRSVFASDINYNAIKLYDQNFHPDWLDNSPIQNHIDGELGAELTEKENAFCERIGRIDILVAGPPCQGNSNLNNYTRRDDPKNLLYLRAVRCAEILNPSAIIIENVPGVLYEKHGVLQTADEYLRRIGYSVSFGVVKMWKIGVAQTRRRMILIASHENVNLSIEKVIQEFETTKRPISWAIDDLRNQYKDGDPFNSSSTHDSVNQGRIDYLFDNNLYDLPNEQRPLCHRNKHTYPSVYGRMRWDAPAPTLTRGFACCGQGRFVHPLERRTLTPHEAARVQFFPDFFDFSGMPRTTLRSAIGNAVPSKAGYIVAMPLLIALLEREMKDSRDEKGISVVG